MAWSVPVLHPGSVDEYEEVGLWGWALSRISGAWVGFKAISETVESSATVAEPSRRPALSAPEVDRGPDGLHWRWPDLPGPQAERRLQFKLDAATAFARANPIDRLVVATATPRGLIVTVGKAHSDLMEALRVGGLNAAGLADSGVAVLQLRLVHPLSPLALALAAGVEHVLVVEEKAPVVETLLCRELYGAEAGRRPTLTGKRDSSGRSLLPSDVELRPSRIAAPLADWLSRFGLACRVPEVWAGETPERDPALPRRTPYFCPGCPHSTSTRVPEGSRAQPGIGCHVMAAWMDRSTEGSVQMGGEGVDWVGQAPFTATRHIFQNIGDGTYFHSGHLAIRQAVAARSDITFKLLFNDAVAMTGGQPVDGQLTVAKAAALALAEGAAEVVVVAADPGRFAAAGAALPPSVALYHRDRLNDVQSRLRTVPGVTVLIYDQVCAIERRRRRKRDKAAAPPTRVVINQEVCEGCGDCQQASNCLAVVPVETPLGRKRAIDQAACNTDLSCLKGFCPSFVTLEGAVPREGRRAIAAGDDGVEARAARLPFPGAELGATPWEILVAGIGGTGVVSLAGVLAHAAVRDGAAVRTLNFTGFAQKGGEVLSHIRLGRDLDILHQARIDRGQADVVLAGDLVVAVGAGARDVMSAARTLCLANTHENQLGGMLRDPDARLPADAMERRLRLLNRRYDGFDAARIATALVGDGEQTNLVLLGRAWQLGVLPVTLSALTEALASFGTAAGRACEAFAWGRVSAADPDWVSRRLQAVDAPPVVGVDALVAHRSALLTAYQNAAYARRYADRVAAAAAAGAALGDARFAEAVARNLFKLMACKDEYEVARLQSDPAFLAGLKRDYPGGDLRLRFHMSPPLLARRDPRTDERGKVAFGDWALPVLRVLAAGRRLRGTRLDPFGWQRERRVERGLLADYEAFLDRVVPTLDLRRLDVCTRLAALPDAIRGFGHVKARSIVRAMEQRSALIARLDAIEAAGTGAPEPDGRQDTEAPKDVDAEVCA